MKYPKTHTNETNKDQTQTTNIKSSKGKATNNIPIRIIADVSIETLQARREWQNTLKVIKEKTYNQDYSTQHGSHSDMKKK